MHELRIRGFEKSFVVDGERREVLRGLDLDADTGEITVILGRSGCGKTTLLRILCGLETPDGGSIAMPAGARLGMVFQEPRLMPWLRTDKNVVLGLRRSERNPEKAAALLRSVGLEGFERAYPSQLSGGMRHRAALARALACEPELVLMDEPFAALDYFTRATMQRELLRIHRERGMGVVFVTHNIDEAVLLGDRICILSDGVLSGQFYPGPSDTERDALGDASIALKRSILAGLSAPG